MKLVSRILVLLLSLCALPTRASSQCAPDGLDGLPCCSLATPKLPKLPQINHQAQEICFRDCGVEAITLCRAQWKVLNTGIAQPGGNGPDCSYRLASLELFDAVGNLKWSGRFRLLYSRTWRETTAAGTPQQVWRFLVNGDLIPTATTGPVPCPLPACAPAFGRVKFSGYIDYARDCATLAWETAWMLTHACDMVEHGPGFPRAGAFHPNRSYSFVGPSAGFVANPLVAVEGGGSPFDASRRLLWPAAGTTGPILCQAEERAFNNMPIAPPFCLCAGGPMGQWNNGAMNVNGACGTTLTPGIVVFPGFLSMGIGTWTNPLVYPGIEDVRWNVTEYVDTDPCTGAVGTEFFFGVSTLGGNPAVQVNTTTPGVPLPLIFIDQSNSMRIGGGPVLNVPYVSDHVLNLNQ